MWMTEEDRAVNYNELRGQRVEALWVSPEEETMVIVCGARQLQLPTDGDCCSQSWWADAVGVKQLVGATVTGAEEIDLPEPADDRSRQEVDSAYGLRITTDRGVCDLIFRNSSNGYYGGSSYPRWADGTDIPDDYRQITEDWSA
jgi:hypothetical protein